MAVSTSLSATLVPTSLAACSQGRHELSANSTVSFARGEILGNKLNVSIATARSVSAPSHRLTTCKLSKGDKLPPLVLKDQDGRDVKLSKFFGRPLVLYFYPANETPGCTKQACSFRDAYEDYRKLGATVVGVSGDTPESHKAFKAKYNLPYTLLSDAGNAVRKEFGVPADFFGALAGRQTYVVNRQGVITLVYNNQFQPEKHVDETLKLLSA
jgi:peroxiredoxin Q/BCP